MYVEIWQELHRNVLPPKLNNAVVGFNANLDRVIIRDIGSNSVPDIQACRIV